MFHPTPDKPDSSLLVFHSWLSISASCSLPPRYQPAFLTFSNAISLLIEPNWVYSCGLTAKCSIPFPFSPFSDPLFSVSQFQFSTSNSSTFFPHVCTGYYYSKPHQHLSCLSLTHTNQYLGVFLPTLCVWHLVLCNTDTRISSFRCTLIFRVSYTSSSLWYKVHSFLLWKVFFIVFFFDLMEMEDKTAFPALTGITWSSTVNIREGRALCLSPRTLD